MVFCGVVIIYQCEIAVDNKHIGENNNYTTKYKSAKFDGKVLKVETSYTDLQCTLMIV